MNFIDYCIATKDFSSLNALSQYSKIFSTHPGIVDKDIRHELAVKLNELRKGKDEECADYESEFVKNRSHSDAEVKSMIKPSGYHKAVEEAKIKQHKRDRNKLLDIFTKNSLKHEQDQRNWERLNQRGQLLRQLRIDPYKI